MRPFFSKPLSSVGIALLTFSALSPVLSVFVGGSAIVRIAGSGAAIAFVLGGLIAALMALLAAELGAAFPRAGGVYPAIAKTLGSTAAFPILVLTVFIAPAIVAFAALGVAEYAAALVPGVPALPVAFSAIALAACIAVLRIRISALITGIFLAIEMAVLLALTVIAALNPSRSIFHLLTNPVVVIDGVLRATPFTTLALAVVAGASMSSGALLAMYFVEELAESRQKIGRVIAWVGLLASAVIVSPVLLMLLSVKDLPNLLASPSPMTFFLSETGGSAAATFVTGAVLIAVFNALVALLMAFSRLLYATGRDNVWPAAVSRVLHRTHARLRTPIVATLILALLGAAACLLGQRTIVILISGDVFSYTLICLAVLMGRANRLTGTHFAAPLYPLLPIFGLGLAAVFVWANWVDEESGRPGVIALSVVYFGAFAYALWRARTGEQWRLPDLTLAAEKTPRSIDDSKLDSH
jgi:fructoselysine transporter